MTKKSTYHFGYENLSFTELTHKFQDVLDHAEGGDALMKFDFGQGRCVLG